ncbi:CHAT domain-containing protein [Paraburkholderia xenovorans]|uniref:CHAT domain-containing protein n=1 Tax=Paraburkholderia xenovorans TaxID=36873 RepID=UPI0038BC7866
MNPIPSPASGKTVLVVTHKDDCRSMVTRCLHALASASGQDSAVTSFAAATIEGCTVVEEVAPHLATWQAVGINPALIIVDTRVHRDLETGSSEGTVAIELLDWLGENQPAVPVLVVTMVQVEGLELEVLKRKNVALVNLFADYTNVETAFARALASLVTPAEQGRRRITVEIGETSAHYHIMDGSNESANAKYEYRKPRELDTLINAADRFMPFLPGHVINTKWQEELRDLGNRLFQSSLISETIGPHIADMLRITPDGTMDKSLKVDVRFEINVNPDETARLFSLPLELVNPDDVSENFLCTRIPMARRIRLGAGREDQTSRASGAADPKPPDHPLRILFVDASTNGSVSFTHERTGEKTPAMTLGSLENTTGELEALKKLAARSRGHALEPPTVLGGGRRSPVGDKLLERVEDELLDGHYDVLHFAGHSVSIEGNGGTFLIFPDRDGGARPVSVRQVAGWMRRGHCRLAVLSSCGGSSLRTAIETMRNGAEAVIGFRWDVNDAVCIDYFKAFYRAFALEHRSLPEAYHDACRAVEASAHGSPLWASAIAVVRD